MPDTITTKRITDLPEDTDVNDNDLFMAGSNGTASLRKKKWSTLLAKIKSVLLANNLTTTTAGYALDARQGKALKDQLDQQNTKIGLKSVYISQTGTYTFQMQPGTLALVVTYYGIYPHYCTGNGQITANQLVIQDGENTITSVNGDTVSVYNRYDRNNMAQAIIFFIEPN